MIVKCMLLILKAILEIVHPLIFRTVVFLHDCIPKFNFAHKLLFGMLDNLSIRLRLDETNFYSNIH